jgi:hypothetical protein
MTNAFLVERQTVLGQLGGEQRADRLGIETGRSLDPHGITSAAPASGSVLMKVTLSSPSP